jgi:hypothetical protein
MKSAADWDYLIVSGNNTLRDLESLIEQVASLATRRAVNPFWAKHLNRTLIRDVETLRFWLWPIENDFTPRTETAWRKLSDALDSAEFALQKGRIYLQSEME